MKKRFWTKLFLLYWATNFFLHFAWEFLQIPFFEGMPEVEHLVGVWTCTVATLGDTGIAIAAYLSAAWSARSVTWFHALPTKPAFVYFATGLLITIAFEFLATEVLDRWAYGADMPTIPLLGTGLTPVLQWLIVPALSLAAVRLMYFGLLYLSQTSEADGQVCCDRRQGCR